MEDSGGDSANSDSDLMMMDSGENAKRISGWILRRMIL